MSALVAKHRAHRAACKAGDTAKCSTGTRHASFVKAQNDLPTLWNTPALAPPTTPREHRHMTHPNDTSGTWFLDVMHFRNFTGATQHGFLDLYSNNLLRNTTVLVDDFEPELSAASITCAALTNADGSDADEHTQPFILHDEAGLVRNPVHMTISFSSSVDDLDLLRRRWVPDNALVFGGTFLANHRHFADTTACGVQIPYDEPFYTIAGAAWSEPSDEKGAVLSLALVPTDFESLHHAIDIKHQFFPGDHAEEEIQRRELAGLPVGDAAAIAAFRARRRLVTVKSPTASIGVNWNNVVGDGAKAASASVNVVPNFITCTNCYAYLSAAFTLEIQLCLQTTFFNSVGGYYYLYSIDTSATALQQYNAGYKSAVFNGCNTVGCADAPGGTATALPDCVSLGTILPTSGFYGGSVAAQFGFSVAAYVTGSTGFSYTINQLPVTATTSTCPSGTTLTATTSDSTNIPGGGTGDMGCSMILFGGYLPSAGLPIDFTATGIPLSITAYLQFRVAASISGVYNGAMQFGRTWSANDFQLGGKVKIVNTFSSANVNLLTGSSIIKLDTETSSSAPVTVTPYKTFKQSNILQPTKILPPNLFTVNPDLYVF